MQNRNYHTIHQSVANCVNAQLKQSGNHLPVTYDAVPDQNDATCAVLRLTFSNSNEAQAFVSYIFSTYNLASKTNKGQSKSVQTNNTVYLDRSELQTLCPSLPSSFTMAIGDKFDSKTIVPAPAPPAKTTPVTPTTTATITTAIDPAYQNHERNVLATIAAGDMLIKMIHVDCNIDPKNKVSFHEDLEFNLKQLQNPDQNRPSRAVFRKNLYMGSQVNKVNIKTHSVTQITVGASGPVKRKKYGPYQFIKKTATTLIPSAPEIMHLFFTSTGFGWDRKRTDLKNELYCFASNACTDATEWLNSTSYNGVAPTTVATIKQNNANAVAQNPLGAPPQHTIYHNEILACLPSGPPDFIFTNSTSLAWRLKSLCVMYYTKEKLKVTRDIPVLLINQAIFTSRKSLTDNSHLIYTHEKRIQDILDVLDNYKGQYEENLLKTNNWELLKNIVSSCAPYIRFNDTSLKNLQDKCKLLGITLPNLLGPFSAIKNISDAKYAFAKIYDDGKLPEFAEYLSTLGIDFCQTASGFIHDKNAKFSNSSSNTFILRMCVINNDLYSTTTFFKAVVNQKFDFAPLSQLGQHAVIEKLVEISKHIASLNKPTDDNISHLTVLVYNNFSDQEIKLDEVIKNKSYNKNTCKVLFFTFLHHLSINSPEKITADHVKKIMEDALTNQEYEFASELLQFLEKINRFDITAKGDTLLHYAIKNNSITCITELLKLPENINIWSLLNETPANGQSSVETAIKFANVNKYGYAILERLLTKANLQELNNQTLLDSLTANHIDLRKIFYSALNDKSYTIIEWLLIQKTEATHQSLQDLLITLINLNDSNYFNLIRQIISHPNFDANHLPDIVNPSSNLTIMRLILEDDKAKKALINQEKKITNCVLLREVKLAKLAKVCAPNEPLLHLAIRDRDFDLVKKLPVSITEVNSAGEKALDIAINVDSEIACYIIHHGKNGDQAYLNKNIKKLKDDLGRIHQDQELFYAFKNGNYNLFRLLCAAGSDVSKPDADGYTIVDHALQKIDQDYITAIIEYSLSTLSDKVRNQIFYKLCVHGNFSNHTMMVFNAIKILSYQMEVGNLGRQILHYIALHAKTCQPVEKVNAENLLKFILSKYPEFISAHDTEGNTAIALLIKNKEVKWINEVIDLAGNYLSNHDLNLIFNFALIEKDNDLIKKVLQHITKLDADAGTLALNTAITSGNNDLIVALCNAGTPLISTKYYSPINNLITAQRESVLIKLQPHIIKQCNQYTIYQILSIFIERNNIDGFKAFFPYFNSSENNGECPLLMIALLKRRSEIFEFLCEKMNNLSQMRDGRSVLSEAILSRDFQCLAILLNHVKKITSLDLNLSLVHAARVDDFASVMSIIQANDFKFDPSITDHAKSTALHYLLESKDIIIKKHITFLIENGANLLAVNEAGITPLELLIRNKNFSEQEIQAYLEHTKFANMDFNLQNKILFILSENRRSSLVLYLIDKIHNPALANVKDSKGWTLLHHAIENYKYNEYGSNKDIASTLIERLCQMGANIYEATHQKQTPITMTSSCRYQDELVTRLVKNHSFDHDNDQFSSDYIKKIGIKVLLAKPDNAQSLSFIRWLCVNHLGSLAPCGKALANIEAVTLENAINIMLGVKIQDKLPLLMTFIYERFNMMLKADEIIQFSKDINDTFAVLFNKDFNKDIDNNFAKEINQSKSYINKMARYKILYLTQMGAYAEVNTITPELQTDLKPEEITALTQSNNMKMKLNAETKSFLQNEKKHDSKSLKLYSMFIENNKQEVKNKNVDTADQLLKTKCQKVHDWMKKRSYL